LGEGETEGEDVDYGDTMSGMCLNTKILLPTYEPGGLDAKIYPHWASSPTYTFVSIKNGEPDEVNIYRLESDELLINLIKRLDVKVVVASSLSIRALELLEKIGTRVAISQSIRVKDAISKFCNGELYFVKICRYKP